MLRSLLIAAALTGCGDNTKPSATHDDGGVGSDAAPPAKLGPCLDRPTNAVAQPGGALPCELISPAYKAVP